MNNLPHRHKEKKGGGGLCVSSLSILQSIDPARLLSAGYVSCTAALPVRGSESCTGSKEGAKESSNREGRKEGKEGVTDKKR